MNAVDATTQATQWLAQLDHALTHADIPAALALFADECYWRDLVAFTWNIGSRFTPNVC